MEIGASLNTAMANLDTHLAKARESAEAITNDLEVDSPSAKMDAPEPASASGADRPGAISITV